MDIVSQAANATPGLGRYPPFKREVIFVYVVQCNLVFSDLCNKGQV